MRVKILVVVLATLSFFMGQANAASGGLPGSGELGFSPGGDRVTLCIDGAGIDACQILGVNANFVAWDACIQSGSYWTANTAFYFNVEGGSAAYPELYPPGYTPLRASPVEDYLAKVVSVRVVVDPGTKQERTYIYPPASVTHRLTVGEYYNFTAADDPSADWPFLVMVPLLHPLSVGRHGVQVFVTLSAESCDGLSDDPTPYVSCIPPGESQFRGPGFTVAPRCSP